MINENRQDIQIERQRIGIKVEEMTLHDVLSPKMASTRTTNHVKSSFSNYNNGNFNYMQKFRPLFSNNHYVEKNHPKSNVSIKQSYELEMAQSFNDFSPRTRRMDLFKFDKNNFLINSINEKECDANNATLSLETGVPSFDSEKFETKHSNNYKMPTTADYSSSSFTQQSSSSVIQSTTSTTNTFDRPEIVENKKFHHALAVLEDNLNAKESHKRDEKPNKFSVLYFGPRQFSTDYQDMSPSLDETPTLELDKNSNGNGDDEKGAGASDSNIFNFENIILESLGLNAKAVKSSSLARCIKSYVINVFRRTFEHFILM